MRKLILFFNILLCFTVFVACKTGGTVNGGEFSDSANAHTHNYITDVIAPTCEEDGYTLHTCSLCGDQYSDQITPALTHDYDESVKDVLCNQFQIKVFTCAICKKVYEEELDIKGTKHSYISTTTYPDRENGGFTTHKCKYCEDSYIDNYVDPVDFSVGLEYTKTSSGYYVSGVGSCKDKEIIIPSVSEQGYEIIGVIDGAFANAPITSVIVREGVSVIQTGAFHDCYTLKEVTISPKTNIFEDIFFNNPVLEKLTMPFKKPIAYYFKYKGENPDGYKALVQNEGSISTTYYSAIPQTLKEINILNSPCAVALSGCDMLTKITISQNATSIGAAAFKNCAGLTEFSIPETVTSIGGYAFSNTAISSITIPDNVSFTANDQYIFAECAQLTQVVLPKNTKCLPAYMFLNCANLKQLQIPEKVTSLGGSLFAGTSVESVTLPNGVECIETHTFNGCDKLKEVILPHNLKIIQQSAFENCIGLKGIEIPQSIQQIGNSAFANCVALEKVILPSNLKDIGRQAFKNCATLNYIKMPTDIQIIPSELLFGCVSLKEISLPSAVTTIYNSAFEGCGIVSVEIPESVEKIGQRIFANCIGLKTVSFLGDNIPLENQMFMGAASLEKITLPKNTTLIPISFCKDAVSLKSVEFGEGVEIIGNEAFMGCAQLEKVCLPTSLKSIGSRAFKGCSALKSVDFSSVKLSKSSANNGEWFADCVSLTEVKNYENIEYINYSLFENTPLQTKKDGMTITLGWIVKVSPEEISNVVTIPQDVTKICDYAFSSCKNIEQVIIPEGVIFLGVRIFGETSDSAIVKISFPDSLKSIDTGTICFLPNIQEIEIGKDLEKIEGNYVGNLKTIKFRGTTEEFWQTLWCNHAVIQKLTIICSDGKVEPTL